MRILKLGIILLIFRFYFRLHDELFRTQMMIYNT